MFVEILKKMFVIFRNVFENFRKDINKILHDSNRTMYHTDTPTKAAHAS